VEVGSDERGSEFAVVVCHDVRDEREDGGAVQFLKSLRCELV
jgi:hypothetical protein